jgi:flagellar hook-associated protein 1 FlgK
MSGLLGSLIGSAGALQAFERALAAVQNNVSNASTPGYAKQRVSLESLAFQPEAGLTGGVKAGPLETARNEYAEQAVRRQQESSAYFDQKTADLARIEPIFDVTGDYGIPSALNRLFQAFSAWSVAPNDTVARAAVIDRAAETGRRFNETAKALFAARDTVDHQLRSVVTSINDLAASISSLNVERRRDFRAANDPALDASMQTNLEKLSELVDYTLVSHSDGSLSVFVGGSVPLVVADRHFDLQPTLATGGGAVSVLDATSRDVTGAISRGRLGALLEMRNETLPSAIADLNRLAAGVADNVNQALGSGVDTNGNPGAALFEYRAAEGAASSLSVTGIVPAELAAALPGAPGGNGNALNLAELGNAPAIDGFPFVGFYGSLVRRIGETLELARENQQMHGDLLSQARTLREEVSGVSLDEEAVRLIQFQRAYQASARLIAVLDELTETTIGLLR